LLWVGGGAGLAIVLERVALQDGGFRANLGGCGASH
jgi:hypothetical protein